MIVDWSAIFDRRDVVYQVSGPQDSASVAMSAEWFGGQDLLLELLPRCTVTALMCIPAIIFRLRPVPPWLRC